MNGRTNAAGGGKGIPAEYFFGMTKLAIDEIVMTSEEHMYLTTFAHSLGAVPKIIILVPEKADFELPNNYNSYIFYFMYITKIREGLYEDRTNMCTKMFGAGPSLSTEASTREMGLLTEHQFKSGDAKMPGGQAYLKAGVKYKIITMA